MERLKKGYRMYKVLSYINESKNCSYTEIIRYAFELTGKVYNHKNDRGYGSNLFVSEGMDLYGYPKKVGYLSLYTSKTPTGYRLNSRGKSRLKELSIKFNE